MKLKNYYKQLNLQTGIKTDPLISIIIPVYNVEQYLDRCMNSIVGQTYENLEIILIDDGSTDGSEKLCDAWALKDSRIKVFHKHNEGVAAARNEALEIAQGEYIGFADPDDWVDEGMFEFLLQASKRFNADIVICGFEELKDNSTRIKQVDYTRCYTRDEALYELVRDADIQNYVWNKLFYRNCVPSDPFPKINSISDMAGIYKFFQNAETVVQINRSLYHYLRREGSLVGEDGSLESRIKYCLAKQIQFEGLCDESIKIRGLAAERYIKTLRELKKLYLSSDSAQAERNIKNIANIISPFYFSHLNDFKELNGFTAEKEQDITSFLQDPAVYRNSLHTEAGNKPGKKIVENSSSKKDLNKEKEDIQKRVSLLQSENAKTKAKLVQLQKKTEKLGQELKNVKSGWSFRIGRAITFVPRKIKRAGSETIYSQFNGLIKKTDNKIYRSRFKPLVTKLFYYLPAKKNRICFCNFAGKGYGDNPKYIAEEIHLRDPSYQLFWLVNDKLKSEFPDYIHAVNINSVKALYIRATSKIWINNIRNDHPVRKKKSQLYLQTWHAAGLGWKRVEADAEERLNKGYVAQAKYDGQITDGILACGKRQEELFKRAFWLNEKAEVLKYGLPKNDYLMNNINNTKINSELRKKLGLEEHVFYVLYAPTFRDDHSLEGYKVNFDEIIKALKNKLQKEVKIIVRLHPNVSFQSKFIKYNKSIINGTFFPDAQELSLACDCLITDYSSIATNFLLMHKPVFICALDLQDYMEKRGLLPDYFDSPLPMAKTNEQLIASIEQFSTEEYIRKADEWFLKNPLYDDGQAAEKTVQWIFDRARKK